MFLPLDNIFCKMIRFCLLELRGSINKMRTSEETHFIYTVYKHPEDFPHHYVVRAHQIIEEEPYTRPSREALLFKRLQDARDYLHLRGLTAIPREPNADPCIVETWI